MSTSEPLSHQWKSVYTTNSEPIAHLIAGKLENEGIQTIVRKESAGSAYGITVGLLGKVDVLVPSDDYERAVALIAEPDDEEIIAGSEDYINEDDEE
jgi:hypothetical protein